MTSHSIVKVCIWLVTLLALAGTPLLHAEASSNYRGTSAATYQTDDPPFTDVHTDDWFYPPVLDLYTLGVISGYQDGTFRPNATITRGQFTKVVVLAMELQSTPPDTGTFADTPPGSTFFEYAEAGAAAGLVTGYDCGGPFEPCDSRSRRYFRPGTNINRGQAAKMIISALGLDPYDPGTPLFADVPQANPFYGYVNAASQEGVITGYACGAPGEPCNSGLPYFRPFGNATRAQASKITSLSRGHRRRTRTPTPTETPPDGATATDTATPRRTRTATPQGTGSPASSRTRTPVPTNTSSPIPTGSPTTAGRPTNTWTSVSTPASSRTPTTRPTNTNTPPPAGSATATWTVIPGGSGITANDPIPCPLWPADNIWNRRIDSLPVHASSDAFVDSIGRGSPLSNGFAAGQWQGSSIGNPYNVVPTIQPMVAITFTDYPENSDRGPYPYPAYAIIGGATYQNPVPTSGDRHVSILRAGSCTLYETWHSSPRSDGSWTAANGAVFNLLTNQLRPDGWTSADAAGFAILPGITRYDEVATGLVTHAIRFTGPGSGIRDSHIWPARHSDGQSSSQSAPPMGTRFRLKAGVDISGYPARLRTILQGLKTYGMFLSDGGDPWQIDGAPDQRWNDAELQQLHGIHGSDFEAVDESGLMIDPNSGQSR
jgi:hypothetical protein